MAGKIDSQTFTLHDVDVYVDNELVGGIQSVSVTVTRSNAYVYEAGKKGKPVDIIQTRIEITGTIERHFIDTDLLKNLAPMDGSEWPKFDLVGVVKGKSPDRSVRIINCVLDSFSIDMNLDNESRNSLPFHAMDIEWLS